MPPTDAVKAEDRFRFFLYGEQEQAQFDAIYSSQVASNKLVSRSKVVCGNELLDLQESYLEFGICSRIERKPLCTDARKFAHAQAAQLWLDEASYDVLLVDISVRGAGIISEHRIEAGTEIDLKLVSCGHEMTVSGTTKYCVPYPLNESIWKVGVEFTDVARLDRAKWNIVFQNA